MRDLSLDQAHALAQEKLAKQEIKPEEFKGFYDAGMIAADMAYVEKMKAGFGEPDEAKKNATIFEAIVHEQIELNEWLGSNVRTIRPSAYDDIKNGVDSIVEIKPKARDPQHLALAIDVTFSPDIEDKFSRIEDSIRSGDLGYIRYFRSGRFRGELKHVPMVVVGADMETVRQLSELWLNKKNAQLGRHPIREVFVEEITQQLKAFAEFARAVDRPEAEAVYTQALEIVRAALKSREPDTRQIKSADAETREDSVSLAMQDYLKRLKERIAEGKV